MTDSFQIYKEWPESVIMAELRVFKDMMYDGAGIAELEAGLHGLDFLTLRSPMSEDTQMFVEAAMFEARMRIDLMHQAEAAQLTKQENRKDTIKCLENLQMSIRNIQTMMRTRIDSDQLIDIVKKRVEERHKNDK